MQSSLSITVLCSSPRQSLKACTENLALLVESEAVTSSGYYEGSVAMTKPSEASAAEQHCGHP